MCLLRYNEDVEGFKLEPMGWNINSKKEILQYAVGGLLYMPATTVNISGKIIESSLQDVKSICLCLEDAIGDDMVKKAELCVKDILTDIYKAYKEGILEVEKIPLIFIRVREPKQIEKIYNLCGSEVMNILCGFNLPKFDRSNCDDYLKYFDRVLKDNLSKNKRPLYINPIIESKNVMYRQRRMEQLIYVNEKLFMYSDYVLNIRVGATDFCSLFGIRRSMGNTVYDLSVICDCLSDILNVFERNYVCSGPVWEYFGNDNSENKQWSIGLCRELYYDKLNGFVGKTCIHPSQLKYVALSNIISYEEYQDALSLLGMSEGLIGVAKGYNDNKMNELKTHLNWAKRVLSLATVYGVCEGSKVDSGGNIC